MCKRNFPHKNEASAGCVRETPQIKITETGTDAWLILTETPTTDTNWDWHWDTDDWDRQRLTLRQHRQRTGRTDWDWHWGSTDNELAALTETDTEAPTTDTDWVGLTMSQWGTYAGLRLTLRYRRQTDTDDWHWLSRTDNDPVRHLRRTQTDTEVPTPDWHWDWPLTHRRLTLTETDTEAPTPDGWHWLRLTLRHRRRTADTDWPWHWGTDDWHSLRLTPPKAPTKKCWPEYWDTIGDLKPLLKAKIVQPSATRHGLELKARNLRAILIPGDAFTDSVVIILILELWNI